MTFTTKKHYSKCSVLLLALRHALKQSCHWSIAWSMKLCWLLTTFQSDAISAHGHTSLVSDKHIPAFRFQSVSPGHWCGFIQPGVKVNGVYYCDVLLLKQLLPDICQAAGDFFFPAHHACARALSCSDTRLRTSHQTWPPKRPDISSLDYRLLRVIQECFCQKQQGMSNIVDELRLLTEWYLLTEWHITFHKVGQKHPSG